MSPFPQTPEPSPMHPDCDINEFAVNNEFNPKQDTIQVTDISIKERDEPMKEVKLAVDCVETKVCIDEDQYVAEENNEIDPSVISTDSDVSLIDNPRLKPSFKKACISIMYMLLHRFVLFVLPFPAAYMGAKYISECPGSGETPILLVMMGMVAVVAVFLHIFEVILRKILTLPNLSLNLDGMVRYSLVLLFNTEQFCFGLKSVSFDSEDKNYCNETFYYFTLYWNWTTIGVLSAMLILWFPVLRSLNPKT